MLLIHSILLLLLFFSFFSLLSAWVRYKFDVISSNAYRSVIRMMQVFDLENCSVKKMLLQVFKRENDLMQ